MRKALLFHNEHDYQFVTAQEVLENPCLQSEEFVDVEERWKLSFVRDSKHHSGPYFRLYYSYEEYAKLYPDRASRYEIVANMRRYQESKWHYDWKKSAQERGFEIEKYFKNAKTNKYKFADAYSFDCNTVLEFQNSYIADDFEERNEHYRDLGKNVVWLFNLSDATIREEKEGYYSILEDNARGFFRVAEKEDNLKQNLVFIQVKGGLILRVEKLERKQIDSEHNSTIRLFQPMGKFTEDSFFKGILTGESNFQNIESATKLYNLPTLWKPDFSCMVVRNTKKQGDNTFLVVGDQGEIIRNFADGCIQYRYVDFNPYNGNYFKRSEKKYSLSYKDENTECWILLRGFLKKKGGDSECLD